MAARKPLVLVNGEIQQLQAGDSIAAPVTEVDVISLTNGESSLAFALGEVGYISGADAAKKAKADAPATSDPIGFATGPIAAGSAGLFQSDGILIGMTGLTPGAIYYLSAATAGLITTVAPSATGQTVTRVGKAISATELEISIERPILL